MQLIITDAWLARRTAIHLSGWQLIVAFSASVVALSTVAMAAYHGVFLVAVREDWPVIGSMFRLAIRDDASRREARYQENLDTVAKGLGAVQARLAQLESLGERVATLAGVELPKAPPASGGVSIQSRSLTGAELQSTLEAVVGRANVQTDWLTLIESRLIEQKMAELMIPTAMPVETSELGSGFGWRIDPFTGQSALHNGLDFPADVGHPIRAAAAGVVVVADAQPAYGNTVEIDHGNALMTRYAHASRIYVRNGDMVRRGQRIASVGSTGRSTGPHLHFEVLVGGIPQDPLKFLQAGQSLADRPEKTAMTGSRADRSERKDAGDRRAPRRQATTPDGNR